jgi:hypothetical protein
VTTEHRPPPEALLCALVLAPKTYSRNRFFGLYTDAALSRIRRRASRIRGVLRQLLGEGKPKAELLGEQDAADGQWLLKYRLPELGFSRTIAFSALEAALVRYALNRADGRPLRALDRELVERALQQLSLGETAE